MNIAVKPGKYILAVSGGVDSMVLLDLLAKQAKSSKPKAQSQKEPSFQPSAFSLQLVVAHFNHGIRGDSPKDEKLVRRIAKSHNFPLEIGYGHLEFNTSEADARKARYSFLRSVKAKHAAVAIITAHHQDDLIETAVLNTIRGTGRRGLTAISQNPEVIRPLLNIPKEQILKYAKEKQLVWREDSTNNNIEYRRNYIRHLVLPKLTNRERKELHKNTEKVAKIGNEIDQIIATISHSIAKNDKINRYEFTNLPNDIGKELVVAWLRGVGVKQYDKTTVDRVNINLRSARAGTFCDVTEGFRLVSEKRFAYLEPI